MRRSTIANFLMNHKREHIAGIEARYGMAVRVEGDAKLVSPDFQVEKFKTQQTRMVDATAPVVSVDATLMDDIDDATEAEEIADDEREEAAEQDTSDKPSRKRRRRRRRRRGGNGDNQERSDAQEQSAHSEDEDAASADATSESQDASNEGATAEDAAGGSCGEAAQAHPESLAETAAGDGGGEIGRGADGARVARRCCLGRHDGRSAGGRRNSFRGRGRSWIRRRTRRRHVRERSDRGGGCR